MNRLEASVCKLIIKLHNIYSMNTLCKQCLFESVKIEIEEFARQLRLFRFRQETREISEEDYYARDDSEDRI